MEFHSQYQLFKELIDSRETTREAVFLSVLRKEIAVNWKVHPFQHPLPFVSSFD